jgi:inner membrane protein
LGFEPFFAGCKLDNLTQTLTAVAISHTGINRKTRFATLTLVIGANLPDIDSIARLKDSAAYLQYHRGITHSLLGVSVLALVLAAAVYWLGRKAKPKSGLAVAGCWILLAAWLGTASHLLMDYTNAYGVRLFLPFSGRWYAWDIMYIFDPLLLALLIVGLGLPAILRLVSEEVGARRTRISRGAIFCLSALVALWGLRDFSHRRALNMLRSHTYRQMNPQRLGAFPSPANPFEWTGIVETPSAFSALPVNTLAEDVDPEDAQVFHKPEPSPALKAASETRVGRIFLDFARFPWGQVEENEDGYDVSIRDLRFYSAYSPTRNFAMAVEFDKSLRVFSQSFSFWSPEQKARF